MAVKVNLFETFGPVVKALASAGVSTEDVRKNLAGFDNVKRGLQTRPTLKPLIPSADALSRLPDWISPEQRTIAQWAVRSTGSAFIPAVAGAGKTTLLKMLAEILPGSVAYITFQKRVVEEARQKLAHLPHVRVGTYHSFGMAALKRFHPTLDANAAIKSDMMLDAATVPFNLRAAVLRLVSVAKQSAAMVTWDLDNLDRWRELISHFDILLDVRVKQVTVGTLGTNSDLEIERLTGVLISYAQRCLTWSTDLSINLIDFDDMIWLPLVLSDRVTFFKQDVILGDEYQDTNEARRLLAKRMLKPNGRVILVGDTNQSIFGFTGADANALELAIAEFDCTIMHLNTSFRCPKRIVTLAQEIVPHIQAHSSNPEGVIHRLSTSAFDVLIRGQLFIGEPAQLIRPLGSNDVILCRNKRPLVVLAFDLIRRGISCHVEGRKIGRDLERLAVRWDVASMPELILQLNTYRMDMIAKLSAQNAYYRIEELNDRVDTLITIAEESRSSSEVVSKIQALFHDTDGRPSTDVTLSTVHAFKGREKDRVFILGYDRFMPSTHARQDWEKVQEENLKYVALTRARKVLCFVEWRDEKDEPREGREGNRKSSADLLSRAGFNPNDRDVKDFDIYPGLPGTLKI